MSTYNNVLGNFISHADDFSDLDDDDDDYQDSASEPEPEMGIRQISSQSNVPDERSQMVESLLSKSNKYTYVYIHIIQIHHQGFFLHNSLLK